MTQFHTDLGRKRPSRTSLSLSNNVSPGGVARALLAALGVLVGLGAYAVVAFAVRARLHLEGESAYWMSVGVLCLLVLPFGWARHLRVRRLEGLSEQAITLYVVAIGVAMFAFGLWRQLSVDGARRRCVEALTAARDVHERIRVYRSRETLPTLSKGNSGRTTTCERLIHS